MNHIPLDFMAHKKAIKVRNWPVLSLMGHESMCSWPWKVRNMNPDKIIRDFKQPECWWPQGCWNLWEDWEGNDVVVGIKIKQQLVVSHIQDFYLIDICLLFFSKAVTSNLSSSKIKKKLKFSDNAKRAPLTSKPRTSTCFQPVMHRAVNFGFPVFSFSFSIIAHRKNNLT